jgi:hypothetical protein
VDYDSSRVNLSQADEAGRQRALEWRRRMDAALPKGK